MKKLISVILSFTLAFSLAIPGFALNDQDIPIIYVHGQGNSIYDADGNDLTDVEFDTESLVKQILTALAETYVSGNYKYAADCLSDIISQFFPALGNDGELIAEEHPAASTVPNKQSNFGIDDASFNYDWRLDPIYNAELLAKHIDNVLDATGAKKVALVAFSEGSCVCSAYLTYHGSEAKVDSYTMIAPGCNSIDVVGALAAGKCTFDAETLDKFVTYYVEGNNLIGNSSLEQLLSVAADVLQRAKVLGFGTAFLQDLYNGINSERAFSDIVLGLYPGFWSFVGDYYYEASIEKNFSGREAEFASIINKIEKYHNEVYRPLQSTLTTLQNDGMKVYVIAKYGSAPFPIVGKNSVQCDGVIELSNASFGATSAKLGKTLPDVDFSSKYVSPDKVIDASTCLFKDSTWFVRGLTHGVGNDSLDRFAETLAKSSVQLTVDDDVVARFTLASEDQLIEQPANDTEHSSRWSGNNPIRLLIKFIKSVFNLIVGLFK